METPSGLNWENRETVTLKANGGKWESWLKAILSFVCGILSSAFFIGGKSRDISELQSWRDEANRKFTSISERFERLDRDGTNRSHWIADSQAGQIASNLAKIIELERKSEQRGEQINVMKGKIEGLERELEAAKNRMPK